MQLRSKSDVCHAATPCRSRAVACVSTRGFRNTQANPIDGVALLVESEGGGQRALMVDAIQGQRQVVIKSLEANYTHVPGIAAATILGDGRVALILDVDAVVAASRGHSLKQEMSLAVAG